MPLAFGASPHSWQLSNSAGEGRNRGKGDQERMPWCLVGWTSVLSAGHHGILGGQWLLQWQLLFPLSVSPHLSAPAASSCSEGANQSLRDVLGLKIKTDHPRLRRQHRAVAATLQLGGEGQGCALA